MLADTRSWSLIETGNWGTLSPTYFFRFNGPGDLYCMGCAHDIRLVCRTKAGVRCMDCGQALAVAIPLMTQELPNNKTQPHEVSGSLCK